MRIRRSRPTIDARRPSTTASTLSRKRRLWVLAPLLATSVAMAATSTAKADDSPPATTRPTKSGDTTRSSVDSRPSGVDAENSGGDFVASATASPEDGRWCNNGTITVPDFGPADPYPSEITVDGAATTTGQVTVDLFDFSHTFPSDLGIMLVSPSGDNLVLMNGAGAFADGVDVRFSDTAAGPMTASVGGVHRPTNIFDEQLFEPAPPPSEATELAAFNGDDPNGTWSLFVADMAGGDEGAIAGGWCLTISSVTTTLEAAPNPSIVGQPVTFTATVASGGAPVSGGAVTFTDGTETLATIDVEDGQATFTTDALAQGGHAITATFEGGGFVPSTAAVTHFVDGPTTTPFEGTWCNSASLNVPGTGQSAPYPSQVVVSDGPTDPRVVTVQLFDIHHRDPRGLSVMLVSPTGENLVLMDHVGGVDEVADVDLVFSDTAGAGIPQSGPLTSGSYLPSGSAGIEWPAPAPAPSAATALETFNGHDPNGTWRLFVMNHGDSDPGSIDSGWCLSVDDRTPTVTTLSSSENPSMPGASVDVTATVTSDGAPVTEGTVTFMNGGATLQEDVPVVDGVATFTADALTVGSHTITARFNGTDLLAASLDLLIQVVDSPTTAPKWCNSGPINVPSVGRATPYPSRIVVSGADAFTTQVRAELLGVQHREPLDLDILLVSPTGQNIVLLSDTGGFGRNDFAVDVTFSDAATHQVPEGELLSTGTYRPTNLGADDTWPAFGAEVSDATTMSAFNGYDPNGTWSLYVLDDGEGQGGPIADGWCLTIDSDDESRGTTTTITSTPNPARFGDPVTLTATVTSGGEPVTDGMVFITDQQTFGAEMLLDGAGQAVFTAEDLPAGTYEIVAEYAGPGPFEPSVGSVIQAVDAPTTSPADGTWCNAGPVISMTSGTASPYASQIVVGDAPVAPTFVSVDLLGIDHEQPMDLDVMLVGPTGENLVLMSDVGGFGVTGGEADITFSDVALGPMRHGADLASGIWLASDDDLEETFAPDSWPAPAPAASDASALTTFNGHDPNGTWSLYVVDDDPGWGGSIADGWCLNIFAAAPTVTTLASSTTSSPAGADVTFTATVVSGASPVTEGTVTFRDGARLLATVPVDDAGRAVFTTRSLRTGSHRVTARFEGAGFVPSTSTVNLLVDTPTFSPEPGRWCNTGAISVSDSSRGPGRPYPSHVVVSGAGASTDLVTVDLLGLSHEFLSDLDIMLVSPTGENLVLISDVGFIADNVDLTFSDAASGQVPDDVESMSSGRYLPTDLGGFDLWAEPAPEESDATALATFNGHDPNGTWRLFVSDDAGGDGGSIADGWCLDISAPDRDGPRARPTMSPAPNAAGWHRGDVTVSWNWRDAGTGLDNARCTDETAFHGEGRRALTATCRDLAGNQSTASRRVRVDTTQPTTRITLPAARRYLQGSVARADFACADGMSGIAACTGTVRDGARIDTSTPGRHRFRVTATDRAGNRRTANVTYTVLAAPRCAGRLATIVGTAGADVLTGTGRADVIVAGPGADRVMGSGGADTICAGGGHDTVDGGRGTDTCRGGPGVDHATSCEHAIGIP